MSKFKKNHYRFWHSPFALFIIFSLIILFSSNMISLMAKKRDTAEKKEQILVQINELKEREKYLIENSRKLETEEGKEEVIREKYQVSKEGERVVIIVEEEEDLLPEEENEGSGFWFWFKKIFNK